jgi:leucyl-tRNA synthetase
MKFNTAIAALMTLINDFTKAGAITKNDLLVFIKLLHPFAPHLTEEIFETLGGEGLLTLAQWPEYDEEKTKDAVINMGVQVNGKVRGNVDIPAEADQDAAVEAAKADPQINKFLDGKNIVKVIFVRGKILNFVVK